jgi:hypothetical protein
MSSCVSSNSAFWSGGYHSKHSLCTYVKGKEKTSPVSRQTVLLSIDRAGLFMRYSCYYRGLLSIHFWIYPSHNYTAFGSALRLQVTAEFRIAEFSMTKFDEFSALSYLLPLKDQSEAEAMENQFIRTWSLILRCKATVLTFLWGRVLEPREASRTCNCGSYKISL